MFTLYRFKLCQGDYVQKPYSVVELSAENKKMHRKSLKNFWKVNNEKLLNNIIRAKSMILDYALNNNFYFFVTCTINEDLFVNDLNKLIRTTTQIIRDLRKKHKLDFKYILIPEKTKKGVWHLHGFFDKSFGCDLYINDNNFLSWSSYDKIGYSSISLIDNYDSCVKYMTKYLDKSFEGRSKGDRLYFCSKGLKRSILIDDIVTDKPLDYIYFDTIGLYASKANMNYLKFIELYEKCVKDCYTIL